MEPIAETLKQNDRLRLLRKIDGSNNPGSDSRTLSEWYRKALEWRYPDECRTKCIDCGGLRTKQPFEAEQCNVCLHNSGPCTIHACRMCEGRGLVCPGCSGMRWTRKASGKIGDVHRNGPCDTCMEGLNVNPDKEAYAIGVYHRDHPQYRPITRAELLRRRTDRSRAAMDEAKRYHAEWAKLHISAKGKAVDRTQERLEARQRLIEANYGPPISGPELLQLAGAGAPRRRRSEKR